jgi:hypothetical protein
MEIYRTDNVVEAGLVKHWEALEVGIHIMRHITARRAVRLEAEKQAR